MGKKDPRVDAYINRAAPFARPVLKRLRRTIHRACPDVEETIRWSSPFFDFKGMLCFMAAFKHHCAFGFCKSGRLFPETSAKAMGHFGRITSINDLPEDTVLAGYVRKAAKLNEAGVKSKPRSASAPRKKLKIPAVLTAAL